MASQKIDTFHYLTQDIPIYSHIELAQMACYAGAKWLQYRSKNKITPQSWQQEAAEIAEICKQHVTTLIICSNVEICAENPDIHGVHLESGDISVEEARKLLGSDKIIGGSAHSVEEIIKAYEEGADYVGFGPYKPTGTIDYSCNHLSLDYYLQSMQALLIKGIAIPVIAAGGVKLSDVNDLLATGIHGLTVSSAVNLADAPAEVYSAFFDKLH